MFEIQFRLSNNDDKNIVVDETNIRYDCFLGSIKLKNEKISILIDWEWIPLLDFALCLLIISKQFHKINQVEEFEFTESDSKLIFQKTGSSIKIFFSFSEELLETSFEEFEEGCKMFYKNLLQEIVTKNENIEKNAFFLKYLIDVETM
jgi:hypothetical protein